MLVNSIVSVKLRVCLKIQKGRVRWVLVKGH